jgi:polyisoprenoid-binding protein YceI
MTRWIFEPGHTSIEFRARHMMVTWVTGHFKDVHGHIDFDWDRCLESTFEGETDATQLWTGEAARDTHLRSADFFDVENHPKISFSGKLTERIGATQFQAVADVTIRGNTVPVQFTLDYLGHWETPFWEGDDNLAMIRRIGFRGWTSVNRNDFGISWQDELPGGGRVVGDLIEVVLDVEAMHEGDLESTGAIKYYGSSAT